MPLPKGAAKERQKIKKAKINKAFLAQQRNLLY